MSNNGFFLQHALELAKKGIGFTSPNPGVGAVIVKNNNIIGEGWHKKAGGKHAEVVALKPLLTSPWQGRNFSGATMYVTLEPCCHWGKTPPCVEAIVKSGIKKVVVGMRDPFEKVNGKGIAFLRKHGIKVELLNTKSVQYKEIRKLNQPFIKWSKTGLPYVILKAAVSMDGKIATRTGESKWITSEKAREDARLERSLCDAVVVGAATVLADNPELAAHGRFSAKGGSAGGGKKLLRVIIDPLLTSDVKKKVFRDQHVFVACTDRAIAKNRRYFEKVSIEYTSFGKNKISIKKLLEYLGKRNIQKVFVEGGAGVHGLFHDQRMIDEVIFYIAPKIIGGADALSAVGGEGIGKLPDAVELGDVGVSRVGEDVKVRGILRRY